MTRHRTSLTDLARICFSRLEAATAGLAVLPAGLAERFAVAADADAALQALLALRERAPEAVDAVLATERSTPLLRLLGASPAFGSFLRRRPQELGRVLEPLSAPLDDTAAERELTAAIEGLDLDEGTAALRIRYRVLLARLAIFDLSAPDPVEALPTVASGLAALAAGALRAGLLLARNAAPFPAEHVASTRLAVIGMGKAGAAELNYVSDVDVIFVAEPTGSLGQEEALEIATHLAKTLTTVISGTSIEPPLWELDANLRPEGRKGALVRTLDSHLNYYRRWAESWEFQALLKARFLAGDAELGGRYESAVAPLVWESSSRENFVQSVQRMRERVTELLPGDQRETHLKLGAGGLRDIEFTVQLLQLVHGQQDAGVRRAGTLPALAALADHGYVGREAAAEFDRDYRVLRLLEHRLQLSGLVRTHLMPEDDASLRVLARSSTLATTAEDLRALWHGIRARVRTLHERLFYAPLLSAVAGLSREGFALTPDQAEARLAAIGFLDPKGALAHIAALSGGLSRSAAIRRNLLPVLLQWLAEGPEPDHGLLVFRRLSEALGESPWYLRMLRDSSGAAQRLMTLLAGSRFVGELFQRTPEAVAWLETDAELRPRSLETLTEELSAIVSRHGSVDTAAAAVRAVRRREVLRLAVSSILGLTGIEELGTGLSDITEATIASLLVLARRELPEVEFATIALGRFGGRELGFGSDADVIHVYRAPAGAPEGADARAVAVVTALNGLTEDLVLPLELDLALRPEGKSGPVVRSLDSYRAYYERWSLTWEAQALLRARPIAGDAGLGADFLVLADEVRYPLALDAGQVREIRRMKARVEAERLPQGADPARHLKLGRGSLSDIEWLVQLIQLENAGAHPSLRTPSTLDALAAAARLGLLEAKEARQLREAWLLASRIRSAIVLFTGKPSDLLPRDRGQFDGVARLLGYRAGQASRLEDDYLRTTRLARSVFERRFYGQ